MLLSHTWSNLLQSCELQASAQSFCACTATKYYVCCCELDQYAPCKLLKLQTIHICMCKCRRYHHYTDWHTQIGCLPNCTDSVLLQEVILKGVPWDRVVWGMPMVVVLQRLRKLVLTDNQLCHLHQVSSSCSQLCLAHTPVQRYLVTLQS